MESARSSAAVSTAVATPQRPKPVTTRRSGGPTASAARPPALRLASQAAAGEVAGLPPAIAALVRAPGPGVSLAEPVRQALEKSLQVPLAPVRVHNDDRTAAAVDGMGVRAFTYGVHIFLGSKEKPGDLDLMAHEVAHVVQQQGRPILQTAGSPGSPGNDAYEIEAGQVAHAVTEGRPAVVEKRTGGARAQGIWPLDEAVQWVEDKAWSMIQQYAPELAAIIQQGPLEWLKEKISKAVETIFTLLAGPVRAITGLAASLQGHFQNLLTWMRDAAAKIAQGDCRPLTEAAEKIQSVIEGIASPIIDRIKQLATRAKEFFTGLWERFGAPAWEFLKRVGGEAWDRIQEFGRSIWDKTAPIRNTLSKAWTWVKNKLGIGEGAEGQNGILQWVQQKAGEAWEWLKVRLEPIKKPLMVVGGVLLLLSPAGPLLVIGGAVTGLMMGIRWIRQHMRTPNSLVDQRGVLERTIIPAMMAAVEGVSTGITRVAAFVTGKLTDIAGGLGSAAGAAAASIFRAVVGIIKWIADQYIALLRWANEKLMGLAEWVRTGLRRLKTFFEPILGVLRKVAEVYMNIMQLPGLVLGALWRLIPACIRDPFVNFLINQILKRIPFFSTLTAIADLWKRMQATAMRAIQQVFREGDVMGAILTVFKFMLELLGIPPDLVTGIFTKAASALDLITRDPVGFLKNVLLVFRDGFMNFFKNIGRHLLRGVTGWLFGALASAGIKPPPDLSFKSILDLVMQILGLTVDHVLDRMAKHPKIGPAGVAKLKQIWKTLTGVWEFLATISREGPAGLWRYIQEKLSNLWQIVLGYVTNWLVGVLIKQSILWLASFVDPTFIMSIVNSLIAIYRAVMTFMERLREMLEVVNSVLDTLVGIAKGAIAGAAGFLEEAISRSMPVVFAFLADQCGLAGVGRRMRDIVGAIQEKITLAIDWVIDKAVQLGSAVLSGIKAGVGAVKAGVGAVVDWWREKREVRVGKQKATISFEGTEENAALVIASSPVRGYVVYIEELRPKMKTPEQLKAIEEALKMGAKLESIQKAGRKKGLTENEKDQFKADFDKTYSLLQAQVKIMLGDAELPESSIIAWGAINDGIGGTGVIAELSQKPGKLQGKPPVDESKVWLQVKDRKRKDGKRLYIRGHLLNENLYGPGTIENLTPITISANATHESKAEIGIKRRVLDVAQVVHYLVAAVYGGRSAPPALVSLRSKTDKTKDEEKQECMMEAELKLATEFRFVAYTLKPSDGTWVEDKDAPAIKADPVQNIIPTDVPPITGDEECTPG